MLADIPGWAWLLSGVALIVGFPGVILFLRAVGGFLAGFLAFLGFVGSLTQSVATGKNPDWMTRNTPYVPEKSAKCPRSKWASQPDLDRPRRKRKQIRTGYLKSVPEDLAPIQKRS